MTIEALKAHYPTQLVVVGVVAATERKRLRLGTTIALPRAQVAAFYVSGVTKVRSPWSFVSPKTPGVSLPESSSKVAYNGCEVAVVSVCGISKRTARESA